MNKIKIFSNNKKLRAEIERSLVNPYRSFKKNVSSIFKSSRTCCCGNPHLVCVCTSWPQVCGRAFGRVKRKVSLCVLAGEFQLLSCDEYVCWPADDMTFVCEEVLHNTCAGDPHSAAEIVAIVKMWKKWRKFNFTEKSGARLCWKLLPRLRRLRRQVKIQLHIH